jgi:UDP-N-acetylglucosamine--N-acetylmuramyl-(pentapeptide) pyrophosphoryl-undecaprenol N-acetylglucosamine transferase
MGGYACVAPVMAARSLSIPVILHEANVIPGRANLFLSRWAKVFALGFEETRNHVRHRNMVYTGMPLRQPKMEKASPEWNVLKPDVFTILVMGGSRGARALNEIAAKAVINLHRSGRGLQIIHLTGKDDEAGVRKTYLDNGITHLVFAFLSNMALAYEKTSLAICRAGASTCAEIARYGVPALLVPYPYAASNHQLANARVLKNAGAADVIEEKQLTAERLAEYINRLMTGNDKLARMKKAALKRAEKNAAPALADLVLETGKG